MGGGVGAMGRDGTPYPSGPRLPSEVTHVAVHKELRDGVGVKRRRQNGRTSPGVEAPKGVLRLDLALGTPITTSHKMSKSTQPTEGSVRYSTITTVGEDSCCGQQLDYQRVLRNSKLLLSHTVGQAMQDVCIVLENDTSCQATARHTLNHTLCPTSVPT